MRWQVTVKPQAPANKVEQSGTQLTVWLKSSPQDNKANRELVKLLARRWRIAQNQIRIISGHNSRRKVVDTPPDVTSA